MYIPPVDRMTHTYENITLPQTSFAGGNDRNLAKISKKLRIKWNFELTVFELSVPDVYWHCYRHHHYFFSLTRFPEENSFEDGSFKFVYIVTYVSNMCSSNFIKICQIVLSRNVHYILYNCKLCHIL